MLVSLARTLLIFLTLSLLASSAFVYSGLFDPAADAPHSRPVYWLMENLRHRGIETRVSAIQVPDLTDVALIRAGAGNYDAMCVGCHLKPGVTDSEMHRGLYPQPPVLATMARPTKPDHAFWIIKHGIKASGMPAWGKSMDDQTIWGLVAFLQNLPQLTPETYHEAVEQSEGHSHGTGGAAMNMSEMEHDGGEHEHEHADEK